MAPMVVLLAMMLASSSSAQPCKNDPCVAPKDFDCPMREMALEYANLTLAGSIHWDETAQSSIRAALNLAACGHIVSHKDEDTAPDRRLHPLLARAGQKLYVAVDGSDTAAGTMTAPFATISHAQQVARKSSQKPVTVLVRAGIYYLQETLRFDEQDSGDASTGNTVYAAYPGEKVTLSGGSLLTGLQWKKAPAAPTVPLAPAGATATCTITNIYDHTACTANPFNETHTDSIADCCAFCEAQPDAKCAAFTFHSAAIAGHNCLLSALKNTHSANYHKEGITCGSRAPLTPGPGPGPKPGPSPPSPTPAPAPAAQAYVTDLPADMAASLQARPFSALYVNGGMQWKARYPNGSPFKPRDGYGTQGLGTPVPSDKPAPTKLPPNAQVYCDRGGGGLGMELMATGIVPPLTQAVNFTVPCSTKPAPATATAAPLQPPPLRYGPATSRDTFHGGYLERFTPPVSFWDSQVPSALTGVQRAVDKNWTNPTEWRVHAYHPQSWGNWGFQVASMAVNVDDAGASASGGASADLHFKTNGGNQEARGTGDSKGEMGARFFDGMLEELDSDHEYHHDVHSTPQRLFWVPPAGAAAPSAKDQVVVPVLETVLMVAGSSAGSSASANDAALVQHLSLQGFTIAHTVPTFCCDHDYEVVSGGDWSIHRGGSVMISNASDVEVSNCLLDSVGGNGIFLDGRVENSDIHHNEVRFSGDSSIAAVGRVSFMDGRAPTYPRNNSIHHNHLHDWGVWGKQTSAYFGGMVKDTHLTHNLIYNGPRAGINQNDGFAGGSEFAYNLLFNTVLDTGDHGNFNSWDRKPFLWLDDEGKPNMVPRQMHIHNNFIIRTSFLGPSNNLYCIDHDDGSSMYNDTANFLVYGGIKFREGLSKHASGNWMAYANGPDRREVPFADQCGGTNNSFVGNTVISGTGQFYGSCAGYSTSNAAIHVDIDDNTMYSPGAKFSDGGCAGSGVITDFAKWQKSGLGQDGHSQVHDLATGLTSAALLQAGRGLLGMPAQ